MSTTISTIAHSLRLMLADAGSSLKLGHTHQLLASARSYTSLAVLQASNEPVELDPSMHWIVDIPQLQERVLSLDLTIDPKVFVQSLISASRACGGPKVYASDTEMADEFTEAVQDAALDDAGVDGQMADTNCTGPWDAFFEINNSSIDMPADIGNDLVIDYVGHVTGKPDDNRPYSGETVNVTAQLRFSKVGKRLFVGPTEIEVFGASLDDEYYAEDKAKSLPSLSQLEAIAVELNVAIEDHQQLDGADIEVHTTNADVHVGYLIDIHDCASSPIIDGLREAHPTEQIWVLGNAFDRISRFERL